MSDLPTRDPNKLSDIRRWEQVMQAYLDGDLLTRDEAANDEHVQKAVGWKLGYYDGKEWR